MAILTRDEAQTILKKVLAFSKAEACEATLNGNHGGNARYARNTVTTAGATEDMTLAVQSNFGKKSGTATVNEFDDAALERTVRRSEELARLAPENPEFMPIMTPQQYANSPAWVDATAVISPTLRAKAAGDSIGPARDRKLVAAGYFEDTASFQSMANSTGLFAYHRGTNVNFNLTVRTEDGTGSGYVERDYHDIGKFDSAQVSRIAIDKAIASQNPKAIEPGKYTVILEPSASVELLQNMFFAFDARQADEGRSFLSKKGGGSKLGEKLVDERVTIYTDPTNAEVPSIPWDQEGQPRPRTMLIEKGVVKNLFYSRYWAQKQGKTPIPFPSNGIMEGGTASLEDLIKDTPRGILVTRTWYIRMVDPQTLLLTGLTRDGTFFVENGKVAFPIKNMRFNESPVIMLNNIEALGKPERMQGNLIPPMKIRDFTFTSASDAV